MNNICGKEKKLKEGDVGCPAVCGDFAHWIVVKEFSDILFYRRPWSVEEIDSPGTHFEIGNKDMVDILLVLEKSQLLGFLWILWNRSSYHYKPMFLFRLVVDFLSEFSCFPAIPKEMKLARYCFAFDIGILFGCNYITTTGGIQKPYQPAPIISWVHPKSDTGSGNSFGDFFQTDFDKRDSSSGTCSISWS